MLLRFFFKYRVYFMLASAGLSACQSTPPLSASPSPALQNVPSTLATLPSEVPPPSAEIPNMPNTPAMLINSNGREVRLQAVEVFHYRAERSLLKATLCSPTEWGVEAKLVSARLNDVPLPANGLESAVQDGQFCNILSFFAPPALENTTLQLRFTRVRNLAVVPTQPVCDFYLQNVQAVLNEQNTGVVVNCEASENDYWASEVGWRTEMPRETAHQLLETAVDIARERQQEASMLEGNWEFALPASQFVLHPQYNLFSEQSAQLPEFHLQVGNIRQQGENLVAQVCYTPLDPQKSYTLEVAFTRGLEEYSAQPGAESVDGQICADYASSQVRLADFANGSLSIFSVRDSTPIDVASACGELVPRIQAALNDRELEIEIACEQYNETQWGIQLVRFPPQMTRETALRWAMQENALPSYPVNRNFPLLP